MQGREFLDLAREAMRPAVPLPSAPSVRERPDGTEGTYPVSFHPPHRS
jgi:hypothetical protein